MKKFYAIMASVAMVGTAYAQQLPNADFEGEWVNCVPWTSKGNTKVCVFNKDTMKTPAEWVISHVIGIGGTGATGVGGSVAGYNSSSAVVLTNNKNPYMDSQVVPGYITLGKSWATNTVKISGMVIENKDGGVFGGIPFAYRPDAVEFMYKRQHGEGSTAKATVVAYSWKGTWTQANVPGDNILFGSTTKVNMEDRDRNILGLPTAQGGAITKTEDAELIASVVTEIEGDAKEWKKFIAPLDYKSSAKPTKFCLTIANNEIFNDAATIYAGDSLTIDNVKLVYYSKLKSLEVNGAAVEGFDPEVYAYELKGEAPAASAVTATVSGAGAKSAVSVDGNVVTVKVTNDGEDTDGLKEHTYTLTYKNDGAKEGTKFNIDGTLDITLSEPGDIAKDQPATITITEYNDGTCDFLLPNLDLPNLGLNMGDIEVKNLLVAENAGVKTYTGEVKDMPLASDLGVADVNVNGTIDATGKAHFDISVTWNGLPIPVVFNGQKESGSTGIDSVMAGAVSMYGTVGAIMVTGEGNVQIYALNGMLVKSVNVAGTTEIPVNKGLYIVRLGNVVNKVIVK